MLWGPYNVERISMMFLFISDQTYNRVFAEMKFASHIQVDVESNALAVHMAMRCDSRNMSFEKHLKSMSQMHQGFDVSRFDSPAY